MHEAALYYVRGELEILPRPLGLVVEIGARNINGSVRQLFRGRSYIGVDIAPGECVDVIASGATYVPPLPAAMVVCMETLEHTSEAAEICRNAARMLMPGGVLLLTAAGEGRAAHSAVDGGPLMAGEYYANVYETDLRGWLSDFAEVRVQVNPAAGDIYATAIKAGA